MKRKAHYSTVEKATQELTTTTGAIPASPISMQSSARPAQAVSRGCSLRWVQERKLILPTASLDLAQAAHETKVAQIPEEVNLGADHEPM